MDNKNILEYLLELDVEFSTKLEKLNHDEECKKDLESNKGFIISEPRGIKKDVKDPNGIFSTRFGQTLQDMNPFMERYKCECGEIMGRVYNGILCRKCNTKVRFIDDDFEYFGWIKLKDEYFIIHPNIYKSLEFLIGSSKLNNIILPIDEKDQDGFSIETEKPKDEPFFGIGIVEFKDRLEEILEYYLNKSPQKVDYYNDILENKDKIFTHSIPVFTTHLRPFRIEDGDFAYGDVNEMYMMMAKLAHVINTDDLKMFRKQKPKKQLLYDIQDQFNKLYKEIEKILSGKKGAVRSLVGGRYNFTSRNVIVPNPQLRIDNVRLSYLALVELLEQSIINILCKSYNMSYNDAYKIWYMATLQKDERVYNIIQSIISNNPDGGIPVIINRNPTINYGGILQMYVVGITNTCTMEVPLQILKLLAADRI